MSRLPENDPECLRDQGPLIDLLIEGRPRDLGGFSVRRALPSMLRRMVGPFIFFDHMGPAQFEPGEGINVRSHPHIALATITYLFEGEILHRDSLGSKQLIRPGDVNWMVAGRGIVHSERVPEELKDRSRRMHGLQMWVALPTEFEETEPRFDHHAESELPVIRRPGVQLRVVAGTAYGQKAPTGVLSPTLLVHAELDPDAVVEVDDGHEQRAVYVAEGSVECEGKVFENGAMLVLRPGARVPIRAKSAANVMMIGGAPLDGTRHIWWNFVASSKDRIEKAKEDWKEGRFPKVPGDDQEFIPLPAD